MNNVEDLDISRLCGEECRLVIYNKTMRKKVGKLAF